MTSHLYINSICSALFEISDSLTQNTRETFASSRRFSSTVAVVLALANRVFSFFAFTAMAVTEVTSLRWVKKMYHHLSIPFTSFDSAGFQRMLLGLALIPTITALKVGCAVICLLCPEIANTSLRLQERFLYIVFLNKALCRFPKEMWTTNPRHGLLEVSRFSSDIVNSCVRQAMTPGNMHINDNRTLGRIFQEQLVTFAAQRRAQNNGAEDNIDAALSRSIRAAASNARIVNAGTGEVARLHASITKIFISVLADTNKAFVEKNYYTEETIAQMNTQAFFAAQRNTIITFLDSYILENNTLRTAEEVKLVFPAVSPGQPSRSQMPRAFAQPDSLYLLGKMKQLLNEIIEDNRWIDSDSDATVYTFDKDSILSFLCLLNTRDEENEAVKRAIDRCPLYALHAKENEKVIQARRRGQVQSQETIPCPNEAKIARIEEFLLTLENFRARYIDQGLINCNSPWESRQNEDVYKAFFFAS